MFTAIDGRAVIVTGASMGIGKGIARVFAGAGADVMLVARDAARLEATADEIRAGVGITAPTGTIAIVAADVSGRDECHRVAAATLEAFGRIDVLCANAGIFPDAPLTDLTEQDVDQVFAVNVKGTMFMVQACVPALTASGHGRVVMTSSITGPITGYPGWSHYGASKAAQLGFLRSAAIELAPAAITVNAVLPGNVVTEGLAEMGEHYRQGMIAAIPQRRIGSVDDIAHAALFLATDEAGYITGQTIVVDGGQVLPESQAALVDI